MLPAQLVHRLTLPSPAPDSDSDSDSGAAMPVVLQRIEAARAGENPTVIARLRSGWAVLGDHQHLRGYCLLLADPVVPRLNDLHGPNRRQFLDDMAMFGDVVLTVTGALRINYEILGNLDPVLHAHLIPRYADEPADLRSRPAWFYDEATMREHPFEPTLHRALMQAIHDELVARGAVPDTLA